MPLRVADVAQNARTEAGVAKHSKPKARKRGVASTAALKRSTSPMEARSAADLPTQGEHSAAWGLLR
jgi:hypothetical protein